jgi:hypothetical protein
MSLDASGQLGGSIVFSKWKGRNYVRSLVIPSNPKSVSQISVRAMMRFLSQYWTLLTAGNKATWQDRADSMVVSTFNAYVSANMSRWRHFKGPSAEDPAAETGVAPAAPTTTASAGVREVQLSIADGAQVPDFCWMIFRSISTGFTPSFSNLVRVVDATATPTIYIDTPLTTGVAQFYRIKGCMLTGKLGTLEAERTATPT